VNPEDSNGNLILSYVRAREEESWSMAEALLTSKEPTHSTIIGYNKGGLIVPIGGLRGLFPLHRSACCAAATPTEIPRNKDGAK